MKVAFLFGALNRGGAESLVYDVCKQKDYAPFEIVCLYRKDGELIDAFHETGVEVLKVGQKKKGIIPFLLSFRKTILANNIDIVHAQTGFNAIISIISLLFTHVKIVTTFHGFYFASAPLWQRKLVYRKSKLIICVSEFEKQLYQQKWHLPSKNKLNVVYNGLDFSKLDSPAPMCDHPVVIEKGSLNITMIGSFRGVRAQSFICKVANALNERDIPFNLFFVGRREPEESHLYDDCVDYCSVHGLMNKVHFLGSRSDIPYLLKQMDLFLYASRQDTFGIAVLEAMASSLPVIVNDWAVMKEITDNGRYATIYETDNVEDCVLKILSFLHRKTTEPDLLALDCQRISREIREKYSIENHIKGLYDIYKSCL